MKKTTLKLFLCLVLSAIAALSLFACGNREQNPLDTDKNDGKTTQNTPDTKIPEGNGDKTENLPSREEFFAQDQLVIYPELPELVRRNFDYKVTVTQGGKSASIPVYNHTMEYDASDRAIGGDLYRRFSQFAFSGERVRVDIAVNRNFEYYSVIPSAKSFETEYHDGVISVYLDKPDYFGIRLDDDDNSILSVFADLPEYPGDIPQKDDPGVIWIEGWHDVDGGILYLNEEKTTLYIAPGAVLNSRLDIRGANSKVLGRGVILDPFENIYKLDIRNGGTETHGVMLCQLYSDGGEFDGPVLLDTRAYNLMTGSNVKVRNYKALSTMMTTDGITAGGKNSTFEHCWIYCADNALVISGAENHVYRDIALGTTCAAIFPQNDSVSITLENIYVFRSNDGIVTNRYNGGGKERKVNLTFRNLEAVDCINVPRFFQGGNMGLLKKTILFDGVSLPHMSGVTNPHKNSFKEFTDLLAQFTNPNDIFTENYQLTFNNLYVGGEAITDVSQVSIENDSQNTVSFTNDGKYTPVERITHRANYEGVGKVYIGSLLMAFNAEVIVEDNEFLLPAEEILKMLRSDKTPESTEKNGILYTTPSALLKAGAAESFEIKDGNLYLTPVYGGENLLLPDEGTISQISEAGCYKVDMVTEDNDGDYVYYLYDLRNYYTGGFSIMFTEEIKKYGAGEYEFRFRARGSSPLGITAAWKYDTIYTYTRQNNELSISTAWKDCSITLKVDEAMLESGEMFIVSVVGMGSAYEYFAVKELELVKTK